VVLTRAEKVDRHADRAVALAAGLQAVLDGAAWPWPRRRDWRAWPGEIDSRSGAAGAPPAPRPSVAPAGPPVG